MGAKNGFESNASEVQRDFEAYHDLALREPVEVTRPGAQTVVIISAERFRALKQAERRVLSVDELSDAEMALIEIAEIPAQHRYYSMGR